MSHKTVMRCCTPPPVGSGDDMFSSSRHLFFPNEEEENRDDGAAMLNKSMAMRPSDSFLRQSGPRTSGESRPSDALDASVHLPSPPRGLHSPRRAFQPIPLNLPSEHCFGRTAFQGLSMDGMSTTGATSTPWWPSTATNITSTTYDMTTAASASRSMGMSYLDTPEVQRVSTVSIAPNAMSHLLYTPQTPQVCLAWRANLDAELDPVNAQHPADQLPPVTTLMEGMLYIGGFPDAETVPLLQSIGVHHIINCCAQDVVTCPAVSGAFHVHNLQAFDVEDYLILHHDYDIFAALLSDLLARGERVFVHCIAGVNRSATLCAAYLMDRFALSPVEAVRVFRGNGRMRLLDNKGFRHQLVDHYLQSVEPRMAEPGLH
ncbi:putative protein phosphatase [Leptomonas pyrrhocoris]|uniref:protein-tyrosine-phosphatase n=1 Tax=Leptomonas pyrrhocoris TaxID=157538 RepID=A0A0N0E0L2_LEPPY|nr:putative protein phosphatase [Leptomonas pyrrhocoris]KPA86575.1 putative protein phosphatase [Leptomonas pyrrhocoris]|eukprot:XP_015665014.1 putative protein phosphatase [Leptomonas pyrrhocoris]